MIYTVNGSISKEKLGITLGHEHFKWECNEEYANQMYFDKKYDDEDIQKSYEMILPVLNELFQLDCRAIVETSTPIGGQNVKLLKKLSVDSGMHIIPCTGQNVPEHIFELFRETFVTQMSNRWIHDFEEGLDTIDGMIIRPNYIKLLLKTGDLSDHDRALLRAAVLASKKTGMPIHCHILEYSRVYDVIDLLEKEKADFSKFLWAHADKEGHKETIKYAYEKGMWIGFDMIQMGTYDSKIEYLKQAIEDELQDRILLSQDYEIYEEVVKNGKNQNCTSFFKQFIPFCEERGIYKAQILDMMTKNPAEFYDIK